MKHGPFFLLISSGFTTGSFLEHPTACQVEQECHARYGVPLPYPAAPKLF